MTEQIHYDADILAGDSRRPHTLVVHPPLDQLLTVALKAELVEDGFYRSLAIGSRRETVITSSRPSPEGVADIVGNFFESRGLDATISINGLAVVRAAGDVVV
jgi:hypothetical protein